MPLSRRFPQLWVRCVALSLFSVLAGCGSGLKEAVLAPASGIVTINGKPAANIMVQFLPEVGKGQAGPTSTAVTNEQGEFDLITDEGKMGAAVGTSKVLFVDTAEERVPQGQQATSSPRIASSLSILGPQTQSVEVTVDNSLFKFDLKN